MKPTDRLTITVDMGPVAQQLRVAAEALMEAAAKIDPPEAQTGIRTAHHCEHSPVDYCWDCRQAAAPGKAPFIVQTAKPLKGFQPDPEFYLEYHRYVHPEHEQTVLLDCTEGAPRGPIGEIVTRHGSWRENNIKQRRFVPADTIADLLQDVLTQTTPDQIRQNIKNLIAELEKPPRYERAEP